MRHVVYTSFVNPHPATPVPISVDHRETEVALANSTLDFTILRNNLYMDLLFRSLTPAVATGQLVNARGTGAAGFVTREDCARAAAAALFGTVAGRQTLDVTGPEALTSEQMASIASQVSGRPVTHVSIPPETLREGMIKQGLPPPIADLLLGFDLAVQSGDFAVATDTVQSLTGRRPQSLQEFLTANRSTLMPT